MFSSSHILFMSISVQPSSHFNYYSSQLSTEQRGGNRWREGIKKKKKKVRFPAISPQATRGIFVPFFILHRFGVETCIRGKPGSSAFFASSAPRIQKDFLKRRRKKEATVLSATWTGLRNRFTGHQLQGFIFEVNFQSSKSIGLVGLSDYTRKK